MKMYRMAWIGVWSVLIIAATVSVARAGTTNLVQVRGAMGQSFTFAPSNIVISPGDTIRWTNVSSTAHDVTHATRTGNMWFSNVPPYWAGILLSNTVRSSVVTFSNVGAYPYICVQHVINTPQPPGSQTGGTQTQTGLVTVAIQNLRPTVSITSPTNLARFSAPATFTITADAVDPDVDGSITNVQFFNGTNLLGADTIAPYTYDASGLAGGWYQLNVRATDNLGGVSTSSVVNVLVNSNRTVEAVGSLFNPKVLSVTVGDTVRFTGLAASVPSHTVTGSGTLEPFCGPVNPGDSCAVTFNTVGSFPFHCVPHQAFFMTGVVQVVGPNLVPTGRMTAPPDGFTVVTGATFTVSAEGSDLFGRIANVRFERPPNVTVGIDTESPYSATTSIAAPGSYQIWARFTDNTALFSTSAPVTVNVVAPVNIQLLSPTAGAGGFQFDYTANPGLTYVVEGSAANGSPTPFVPLRTNVANANRITFTDTESAGRSNRAYRVFRRP